MPYLCLKILDGAKRLQMEKDFIINKIRKLLALASSKNENEAQSALLMAQKLMAIHNIEMSQVDNVRTDHNVIEEEADSKRHKTIWKRRLAQVIANNFKCGIFFRGHGTYSTIFVGKMENIDICKTIYLSAVRFIDKFFSEYWRKQNRPVSESIKLKNNYALGFICKLNEKFKDQNIIAEQEGWALVLVNDSDVVDYMERKNIKHTKAKTTCKLDVDALRQGYIDCDNEFGETGQEKIE